MIAYAQHVVRHTHGCKQFDRSVARARVCVCVSLDLLPVASSFVCFYNCCGCGARARVQNAHQRSLAWNDFMIVLTVSASAALRRVTGGRRRRRRVRGCGVMQMQTNDFFVVARSRFVALPANSTHLWGQFFDGDDEVDSDYWLQMLIDDVGPRNRHHTHTHTHVLRRVRTRDARWAASRIERRRCFRATTAAQQRSHLHTSRSSSGTNHDSASHRDTFLRCD